MGGRYLIVHRLTQTRRKSQEEAYVWYFSLSGYNKYASNSDLCKGGRGGGASNSFERCKFEIGISTITQLEEVVGVSKVA